MPSLSQLLTSHGSLLVFDAASLNIQVGLLRPGAASLWHNRPGEAGAMIFTGAGEILRQARLRIESIEAFAYCEGPGSMLGIRTVAMALRTWQELLPRPAYAYQSLAIAAQFEWARKQPRDFSVIADARRETWHCQPVDAGGRMPRLIRLPANGLPAGELVTPENFRSWTQPPRSAGTCSYDLAEMLPLIGSGDFFRLVEAPDAFQHELPDYRKWSAQIHRASAAVPRP